MSESHSAQRGRAIVRNLVAAIAFLFAVGVLGFAWLMWNFNRPPFDLTRLQQLRLGMTQAEVRSILGAPTSDYGDHWTYSRFMAWPLVIVEFDENNRFTESEYDY